MKTPLLFLLMLLLGIPQLTAAAETKVLDSNNAYGGKTMLTTYDKSDQEFKLTKKVEYLDGDGITRKVVGYRANNDYNELKIDKAIELYSEKGILESIEVLIREEKSRIIGYYRVLTFYNKEGQKTREEIYYNKSDFQEKIYSKSIDYFREGVKIRSEYFLAPQESKRTGYHKLVVIYKDGKVVEQRFYDHRGREI